ncbi:hypothetical protein GOBAR_DD27875 [Gossypium barbadense]|nr:hypothetical protein GOBAR_DD27875 [Gossypium barbadense]
MSYRELYQNLFNAHVVFPYHLKPLQPQYPKWYDANAQCDCHAGTVGHSIEHCTTFKKLVERLISMGVVKVDDSSSTENPLPNHNENGVNMIGGKGALPGKGLGRYLQRRIEVPVLKGKQDHFGLGYKPGRGQRKKEPEKRQKRRRARLSGEKAKWEPMIIPHVSKTFVSGGVIHAERNISVAESIEETLICKSMPFMSM